MTDHRELIEAAQSNNFAELGRVLSKHSWSVAAKAEALGWCCMLGNIEGTRQLLAAGAIPQKDEPAVGTLHWMVATLAFPEQGTLDCLTLILETCDDIDAKDSMGRTPYLCAASMNAYEAMLLLEALGTDVHASDHRNLNALHWSLTKSYNEQVVDHLLCLGVRADQVSHYGHSLLDYARMVHDNPELEKKIEAYLAAKPR